MKIKNAAIAIAMGLLVGGVAFAGDFVLPPTSLPQPLKKHVQRFVDSTQTRDYQAYPRTYRASPQPLKYYGPSDRFYGTIGNSYFAYTATSMITGGYPMVRYAPRYNGAVEVTGELYLPPAALYDKFMPGSGWTPRLADGQQFLTDFDIDDRGYHYLAYSSFGWGILRDNGGGFELMWHNDPGSTQSLPADQVCTGDYCPLSERIVALTTGGKYYALVGNGGTWGLWDTTTPSAPKFIGAWLYKYRITPNDSGTMFAATDGSGTVRLITTSQFVSGDRSGTPVSLGGSYYAAAADGDFFWFLPYGSGGFYRVSPTGVATPYNVSGSTLQFFTAQFGADYLVGVDGPTPTNLRLYTVSGNSVIEASAVTSYMTTYYKDQNEQPSSVRHHGMLPIRYNGKTYLIWSMHGVGDVYEVQAGDAISVTRNTAASLGTKNTNSPNKDNGPYYGDLVTFDVVFSGQNPPSTINWTFGNPESTSNTTTSGPNASVTHRYAGLSTSTAISAAKTVSAVGAGLPDLNDTETVNLLVPKARVLVPGTSELVETSKNVGDVFLGAKFYDASDGVIESHQAGWTLDAATEAVQTPGTGFGVGGCGAHTLAFAAKYDSYTSSISGIGYTVRPFVSSAELASSTATTVTFNNTSKVGSGFDPNAVWVEKWELVNSGGTVLISSNPSDTTTTLGQKTQFTVNKVDIPTTGGKIRLTISVDVAWVPSGCDAYLTSVYEIPLEKPDPDIVKSLCSNPTTAGGCTLSVGSLSGGSKSGWTYQWYLDNQFAASTATYAPSFGSVGSHTVRLIATNPFGSGEDTDTFSVSAPPCSGSAPQGSLTFTETPISTRGRQFDAVAFGGYTFQDCDNFAWNFGDGSSGTGRSTQHTYSSDGTYSVTLTVTNTNGSANVTRSITVGTVAPPPPPPPPPTSCADPTNKVFVNYLGPQSGCKPGLGAPDCYVGEQVSFSVDTYGLTLASCHAYSWSFGDGTSSTSAAPLKAYATAGSFPVTLTVSNGTTSGTHTYTLKTKSQTCGTEVPHGLSISYFGTTSACAPNNSTPCKEGEEFIFSILSEGYSLQSCETLAWNFGDGGTSATNQPRHTFVGTGPFTVTLAVTNTLGTYTTSSAVRFFDPNVPKPVVTLTPVSTKAKVGSTVHFYGDFQTGAQNPLVAINWKVIRTTFGDEVIDTASNVGDLSYTFNEIGDYRIEVTATNAGGVSTPAIAYVTVAEVQEYSFLIPVVAHLKGNNNTAWRTDLQIFNTDPLKGPIEFDFEFKGGAATITKSITMTSSTQIYEDFLGELSKPFPSLEDAGPMIVRARGDSPPQMWTRTYTVDASGNGSYGQLIPAISLDSSLPSEEQPAKYVLPGLEISPRFRTNIGLVNPSTQTITVNVLARDDSELGVPLGNFDIQVPPLALVQIGNLANRIPAMTQEPFSLNIQPLGNSPVVVYGSMIDMNSNDPVYVAGVRDADQESSDKRVQIVPGAGHLEQGNGTWRSDVVVYNPDLLPVKFDLYYFDGSGTKIAEAKNQILGNGAFLKVEDVLKWDKLDTDPGDSFGIIKVVTNDSANPIGRYPIVFQRTYKDRDELGSFGQGIPAISPAEANVKVDQPAFIAGVRSDESYYTNLGLVAVGDEPAVVQVTLLHDGSGSPVGTWQYVVDGEPAGINPNASLIVTNIIRAISPLSTRGTLKIEVLSGGDVWAYASVIAAADPTCGCSKPEQTFDPEYIPAVRMPTP